MAKYSREEMKERRYDNDENERSNRDSSPSNQKGRGRNRRSHSGSKGANNSKYLDKSDSHHFLGKSRDNDPSWYFLDKEVAEQAASISFNEYLGVPVSINSIDTSDTTATIRPASANIPTIFRYDINPSPTVSMERVGDGDFLNGIDQAALSTYSVLSSINAKTTQYAPQDISILLLQLGEVISMMEHIRRAFGVAFTYNQRNRDLPTKLLESMGFIPSDFMANMADHRLEFNGWVTAINKIPFLTNIAYLYKCADIYEKVYTDSESSMAQIVYSAPYSTWILDEAGSELGTVLRTIDVPGGPDGKPAAEWTVWRGLVENMITTLFESATFNYIFSDIKNYAEKVSGVSLMYLDYLTEGYTVPFEYNPNYLLQMHNATWSGSPRAASDKTFNTNWNDVTANAETNRLLYNPAFPVYTTASSTPFTPEYAVLDMPVANPSTVDKIEATRYISMFRYNTQEKFNFTMSLPDHYVVKCKVFSGSETKVIESSMWSVGFNNGALTIPLKQMKFLGDMSQYDWSPLIMVRYDQGTDEDEVSIFGDLNYYTTVDQRWVNRLIDLSAQSLFRLR